MPIKSTFQTPYNYLNLRFQNIEKIDNELSNSVSLIYRMLQKWLSIHFGQELIASLSQIKSQVANCQ